MPIVEGAQTAEQIAAGNKAGAETRQKLANQIMDNKVFKSLEIPVEEETQTEEQQEEQAGEEEQTQEEETGEEQAEEAAEETEEEAQGEENEESGEEETMVPKSKVQARIDRLMAENKRLRALQESKAVNKASESNETVDEQTKQLRAMSKEKLEELKDQVEDAKLDARIAKDNEKYAQLKALDKKIEETIRTGPARFGQAQKAAFSRMADKLAAGILPKDLEKAAPEILKLANQKYAKYTPLHNEIEGQAIALEMAYEEYMTMSQYSVKKGTVNNLKSQVNTLKKKTSLDTKQSKSTGDSNVVETLRKNASGGTTRDKIALVKGDPRFNVDAMIPVEYK